jgi:hypothetical protein
MSSVFLPQMKIYNLDNFKDKNSSITTENDKQTPLLKKKSFGLNIFI